MTFLRHLGHFDRIAAIAELEEDYELGLLTNEEIDLLLLDEPDDE